MTTNEAIDDFLQELSPLARHFGALIEKLDGGNNLVVRLAATLVSHFTTEHGYVCLDLATINNQVAEIGSDIELPTLKQWSAALRKSSVVGTPGDFRPLILDEQNRLFLHRYWVYEDSLARQIRQRSQSRAFDVHRVRHSIAQLFPPCNSPSVDWQKVVAVNAIARGLVVITGGPGTGKTTTIVKTLALLACEGAPHRLRIALAAPTGKAATRLQDAIVSGKKALNCPDSVKAVLPETATTIHRLLGANFGGKDSLFSANNPLPYDVVVVDEASMIDLALMLKLFEALPGTSRIILAGDKDQLASVEAGAVLGEICDGATNTFSAQFCADYASVTDEQLPVAKTPAPIGDAIVQLHKNYRFESVDISNLASAVNHGDAEVVKELLSKHSDTITWQPLPKGPSFDAELRKLVMENWRPYFECDAADEALQLLNRFRVLTPLRYGNFGVLRLNERIEQLLGEAHLIRRNSKWYRRRPVLITQNDYGVKLFNGDVGTVQEVERYKYQVVFPSADGKNVSFFPARLPMHETVYATTIHKSQGSEFDHVLLIVPSKSSAILNRELIYTALTRARKKVTVWADEELLEAAVLQKCRRVSTLGELINR